MLWENPNPTSAFSAQSIDLSNKDWKIGAVFLRGYGFYLVDRNTDRVRVINAWLYANGQIFEARDESRSIETKNGIITFLGAVYTIRGDWTQHEDNSALIPQKIIKIA